MRDLRLETLREVKAVWEEWKEATPRRLAVKAMRAALLGFRIVAIMEQLEALPYESS